MNTQSRREFLKNSSLALATPDAYNPFNGGCIDAPTVGDCTPSSPAAVSAIGFQLQRYSKTTLMMGDFRATRPDLFRLPARARLREAKVRSPRFLSAAFPATLV